MKDAYAVLRQKEKEILRVRREIEALRAIIPLLSEEQGQSPQTTEVSTPTARQTNKWPLEVREVR
ncbi:MAG: hypothetical protein LAN83_12205 [Acidobacteriia bacterium]|nr:hypothetical protein [Terriglobia bacterium]